MKFVWLPKAIANRHALIDYIAQDNLRAAIEQDSQLMYKQTNWLFILKSDDLDENKGLASL